MVVGQQVIPEAFLKKNYPKTISREPPNTNAHYTSPFKKNLPSSNILKKPRFLCTEFH